MLGNEDHSFVGPGASKFNRWAQGGEARNTASRQALDFNDSADENYVKDAQSPWSKPDSDTAVSDSGSFTGSPRPSGSDGSDVSRPMGQDSQETSDGNSKASGCNDDPNSRMKKHRARYAKRPQPQEESDSDTPVSDSGSFTGSPWPSGSDGNGMSPLMWQDSQETSDGNSKASDCSDASDNRTEGHRAKYADRHRPQVSTVRSSKAFPVHWDQGIHLASFLLDDSREHQDARERDEARRVDTMHASRSRPQETSNDCPASECGSLTGNPWPTGNNDQFALGQPSHRGTDGSSNGSRPSDGPNRRRGRHHARYTKRPQVKLISDHSDGRSSTSTRVNTYGGSPEFIGAASADVGSSQGISMLPSCELSERSSLEAATMMTPKPNREECDKAGVIHHPSAHATVDSQVRFPCWPRDAASVHCLSAVLLGDTQFTHQQFFQDVHDRTEIWCRDQTLDFKLLSPLVGPQTSAASDCGTQDLPVPFAFSLPEIVSNDPTSATSPTMPHTRSLPLCSLLNPPLSLLRSRPKGRQQQMETKQRQLRPARAPKSVSMKGGSPVSLRCSGSPRPVANSDSGSQSVCVHQ